MYINITNIIISILMYINTILNYIKLLESHDINIRSLICVTDNLRSYEISGFQKSFPLFFCPTCYVSDFNNYVYRAALKK